MLKKKLVGLKEMSDKSEQRYAIEEVAEMLKVVYMTVYRWIQDGKLKTVRAGKHYRIRQSDLDKFLENKS